MLTDEQKANMWSPEDFVKDLGDDGPDFSLFSIILDKGDKARIMIVYKNKIIGLVNWRINNA